MPNKQIQDLIMERRYLQYMQRMATKWRRKSLKELVPKATEPAIDLMKKLFTYDPKERLSAHEVLQHPFLADMYNPKDPGLKLGDPISFYDFEFETFIVERDIIRELILDEIIISNSKEARGKNRKLKAANPKGILETKYFRKASKKKVDSKAETRAEAQRQSMNILNQAIAKAQQEQLKQKEPPKNEPTQVSRSPVKKLSQR